VINDTLGHGPGDQLLIEIAQRLSNSVRSADTVARTGGDEFSIILEEPSGRVDAEMVAESLSHLLTEPFMLAGKTVRIGASIGIAVYPEDARDPDALCIEADLRMYQVKQDRRDVGRTHHEDIASSFETHTLAS
jgi:diguanylate cyclase (GGDEF)-like protein